MKARVPSILKPLEWACLGGWLLCAGILYALLIHPSMKLYSDVNAARSARDRAEARLDSVSQRYEHLQSRIDQARTRLTELGGPPPPISRKDLQITRLTTLAQECGLTIDRYSPLGHLDQGDYGAAFVQFVGHGTFAAIHSFFQRVEDDIDFVDITHLTITAAPMSPDGQCAITWSCQINGMQEPKDKPPTTARDKHTRPAPLEVALNEP
jgi:hypothetical protein